jgi:hypothetical protein
MLTYFTEYFIFRPFPRAWVNMCIHMYMLHDNNMYVPSKSVHHNFLYFRGLGGHGCAPSPLDFSSPHLPHFPRPRGLRRPLAFGHPMSDGPPSSPATTGSTAATAVTTRRTPMVNASTTRRGDGPTGSVGRHVAICTTRAVRNSPAAHESSAPAAAKKRRAVVAPVAPVAHAPQAQ